VSLNIGTLVGYLQLDDTKFTAKADKADQKINGLKLHLEALGKLNPKISVEVETQTKQLEVLQARIADLKAQSARGINVNVEMVQALVDLDRIQVKLREMHNAEIRVHVDDTVALTKLAALKKATDSISKANLGSVGGMFGNIAAFGPAVLPMINMLPGGLAAIGSGAVASAAGVGVLALAFHGLGASVQAYQKYQDALPYAKNASQVAALKKTLALSPYGDMNASGRDFTRTVATRGSAAATGIKQAAQAGVFPGADRALKDILPLAPTVEHLMLSLGTTVGDMTDEAAKALNSPFWRQWFVWLGNDAKTQLPLIGDTFGNFIKGMMQGIQRFAPEGTSMIRWVDDLSKKFAAWTGSPQFDHFIATTAADAHMVGQALQPLGPILANIYKGLSATGNVELLVLGEVLRGMASLPVGVLQAIGVVLPIIFLGLKAIALTTSIVSGIQAIGGAFTALSAAAAANPITAVALALAAVGGAAYLAYKAFDSGKAPLHASQQEVQALADTYDHLTGAITTATRQQINASLSKGGSNSAMANAGAVGITGRTLIGASLGNTADIDTVKAKLIQAQAEVAAYYRAGDRQRASVVTAEIQAVKDALNFQTDLAKRANQTERLIHFNTELMASDFKGISKPVALQILAGNLLNTTQDVATLAKKMDLTRKQIAVVINAEQVPTTTAQVEALIRAMGKIETHKDITVSLHLKAFGKADILGKVVNLIGPGVAGIGPASAGGGTIPGPRSPYGDKVLTPLAPGEEVISNSHGQADKWRPMLKAINAGMAGGGTVPGDPLAGFGPGSIPATSTHHHRKGSNASHAAAIRRKALQARLALINAQLAATQSELAAAQNWSQSFAGNAFSADLTPFEKPGPVTTSIINGMKVTQSGATDTSPHGILTAMLAYQKSQQTTAGNLAAWVKKLRNEGVSKAVLAQMQAAGPQGIAEIQALTSGTTAQVREFNASNVATTASLNQTGAMATSGQNYSALQQRQLQEQSMQKVLKQALASPVPVRVVAGHLRPV
jgi:hypothetical protein